MKTRRPSLRLGDLIQGRLPSVFDLTPAINRLNRELQHVEVLEEAKLEVGRVFPIVTKVFMRPERQPVEGTVTPMLVVRFPTPIDDPEEWGRRCRAWQRPPSTVDMPDLEEVDSEPET